jgi:hypothetical protein
VRVLGKGGHSLEAEKALMAAHGETVPAAEVARRGVAHGQQSTSMKSSVTHPQLFAVTLLTLLLLAAGIVLGGVYGNYLMRSRQRGGMARAPLVSMNSQTGMEAVKGVPQTLDKHQREGYKAACAAERDIYDEYCGRARLTSTLCFHLWWCSSGT